jgi:hypothetical protein
MKGRRFAVLLAGVAAVAVAACQDTREILGQGKRSPDEFTVYSRTPLSVPPDYRLRPPGAGGAGAGQQPGSPGGDTRTALLGRPAGNGGGAPAAGEAGSAGTAALMQRTGAAKADPNIRTLINRESTILAEADQSFSERLMFWRSPTEYGTVIDPKKESERIRETQASGKAVTEGETPTIQRRPRALLEGIFN